jgi:NAD(P)-dependent dehydrogenase (short-subunit alcohol dehydrogenase family)
MSVANPQRVRAVADEIWADGLSIDILVNNAAIDPKVKGEQGVQETSRLENFPFDQWDLQVVVGLTAPFCAVRFLVHLWLKTLKAA